jgi:hypothetical protein
MYNCYNCNDIEDYGFEQSDIRSRFYNEDDGHIDVVIERQWDYCEDCGDYGILRVAYTAKFPTFKSPNFKHESQAGAFVRAYYAAMDQKVEPVERELNEDTRQYEYR